MARRRMARRRLVRHLAGGAALQRPEEHRDKEHGDHRGAQHAANHARAQRLPARRRGPARDGQRNTAQDEGQRGHDDRPQPQLGRLDRRVVGAQPLLDAHLHRELEDQDGVLGRQRDQHRQADLEVDVVLHAAYQDGNQRAEQRERHSQQHADRQRPFFVLRGQDQEHHQQREGEHQGGRRAGLLLLVRLPAPRVAVALAQHLGSHFLHGREGLPGAVARRGVAGDLGGREVVEAGDKVRPGHIARGGHGLDRHHVAMGVAHVDLVEVFRARAELRLGLQDDLEQPAVLRELAHVERAEHGLQGRVDLIHRYALRLGALAVQVHQQLARARVDCRAHAAQLGPLARLGDEGPRARLQLLVGAVAGALQPELEAARGAQAGDGRRIDRNHQPLAPGGELAVGLGDQVLGTLALAAFVEALQRDEQRAGVGLVLGVDQAVAVRRSHRLHARLRREPLLGPLGQVAGTVQARRVRQHHRAEQVALVLHGQERRRNAHEQQHARHDQRQHQRHGDEHAPDHQLDAAAVAFHHAVEAAVEPLEEAVLLVRAGLEEDGRQRR
ncbi:hypothetical protein LMG19282_04712 [Cupriavidus campinensis]|nr:hypothetical protein LMG19282_04712 [Cupriavidus campinensis]